MTLKEAKDKISHAYIGKHTIHGVGTGGNAVTVYSEKSLAKEMKQEITSSVFPHQVHFLASDRPRFAFW